MSQITLLASIATTVILVGHKKKGGPPSFDPPFHTTQQHLQKEK